MNDMIKNKNCIFRLALLAVWTISVSIIYYIKIGAVDGVCDYKKDPYFCTNIMNIHYVFYSLYAIITLIYGVLLSRTKVPWKKFTSLIILFPSIYYALIVKGGLTPDDFYIVIILMIALLLLSFREAVFWILSLFLLTCSYRLVMVDVIDVRTYSYEFFLLTFYIWSAFLAIALILGVLYPKTRIVGISLSLIATIAVTFIFAEEGRGSIEQTMLLIDRLNDGKLMQMLFGESFNKSILYGIFVHKYVFYLTFLFFYIAVGGLFCWIITGEMKSISWKNGVIVTLIIIAISFIPLASISYGKKINKKDVNDARIFIEDLVPKVQSYYNKKSEYPQDLSQIMSYTDNTPHLIDIFEYLAYGAKGAYYLSNAQKYCFIFMNQREDNFGYYSLTSDRDWRFFPYNGVSLEEKFETVCDEGMGGSHEGLVAGHLGVMDLDDPVALEGVDIGVVARPAATMQATEKLDKALKELGKIDPSTRAGPAPAFPPPAGATVKDFKKMIEENSRRSYEKNRLDKIDEE